MIMLSILNFGAPSHNSGMTAATFVCTYIGPIKLVVFG